MTKEEVRFQVALSCIQGVLEAKHGIIGEVVPAVAVAESLRIADEFVKQWFKEDDKDNSENCVTLDDECTVKYDFKNGREGKRFCRNTFDGNEDYICRRLGLKYGDKISIKIEKL